MTSWTVSSNRLLLRDGILYTNLEPTLEIFELLSGITLEKGRYIYQNTKKVYQDDESVVFDTPHHTITFNSGRNPIFVPKSKDEICLCGKFKPVGFLNGDTFVSNECVDSLRIRLFFDFDEAIDAGAVRDTIREWIKDELCVDASVYVLKNSLHEKYHVVTNVALLWSDAKELVKKFVKKTGLCADLALLKNKHPALRAPLCEKFQKRGSGIYEPWGVDSTYSLRDYYITPLETDIYPTFPEEFKSTKKVFNKDTWKIDHHVKHYTDGVLTKTTVEPKAFNGHKFVWVDGVCVEDFNVEHVETPVATKDGFVLIAKMKEVMGIKRLASFKVVKQDSPLEVEENIPEGFLGYPNTNTVTSHPTNFWFYLGGNLFINEKNLVYRL